MFIFTSIFSLLILMRPAATGAAAGIVASGCLEDADALNYDEYEMSELDVLMADVIDDAPQAAAPNEEMENCSPQSPICLSLFGRRAGLRP